MISREKHDRLLKAEKCRRDFSEFVREFWEIVEPGTPLVWSWHLSAICSHLQAVTEGLFDRLIICIPPGFAKSMLVSVMWQAWEWTRTPSLKSLFGSYDESLTHRDSGKCKDIIKSKKYQELFRPQWSIRKTQDAKGYYTNTEYGERKVFYVGSAMITGWRGGRIVIDDPLSAKNRYNRAKKAEVVEFWDKVLSTRSSIVGKSVYVIIMQRLADDDLIGHIKKNQPGRYVELILSNEYDPENHCETPIFSDPRTEPGELLFPAAFDREKTEEKKRDLGEVDYQAQFQHNPFPLAGSQFDSEHFLYWTYAEFGNGIRLNYRDGKVESIRVDLLPKFMTVDVASSEKRQADYTVIGLFARTSRGEIILLHRVKIQAKSGDVVQAIADVYRMRNFGLVRPMWVGIESNGVGLPILQNVQALGIPVLPIHVSQDKITLSATAIVRFQCGQIFMPDPSIAPWVQEFIHELVAFPSGEHDDDVSMISLAANSVFEDTIGVIGNPQETIVQPIVHERRQIEATPETRRRFGFRNHNH